MLIARVSPVRPRRTPRPRASLAWRALALVASVALLAAQLAAGGRYFACAAMDRVMLAACCPARAHAHLDRAGHADASPSIDDACCETRRFESVAPVALGAPEPAIAPALAWILPVPPAQVARAAAAPPARRMPIRAGPEGPAARAALLQVFLC
jgi:hypothetical protein